MDTALGTPQTALVPDAARESVFAQQFFYTLGDLFGGTDSSTRITSPANTTDIGVDITGTPYVRGTTQTLGNSTTAPAQTFTVTPGMVLAGLIAVFLITGRSK